MNLFLGILLIILAFFGGMVAGMFLLRRQFEKEFASNPRLNVEEFLSPSFWKEEIWITDRLVF